jgi:hypothetical protein
MPERVFTVRDSPLADNDPRRNTSRRWMRFTEVWPPKELWQATPNWRHALDEEGVSDQDETTIKPAQEQRFIAKEVDFTAGEAWLPDDRVIPVIIGLGVGHEPHFIACFDDTILWEFECRPGGIGTPQLSAEQRARFPLRIVSRLSRSPHDPGHTIRIVVDERGGVTPWKFDD